MSLRRIFLHTDLLVAGAAAFSMSTLFSAMKPVLLTRYVEQGGLDESLAGIVVAMPFVGIAASSLLFSLLTVRPSVRNLGLLFGLLLIAAELASALYFQDFWLVVAAQLIAGICVGVLMGATSRVVAVGSVPDESFGFIDMCAVASMALMVAGVGYAVQRYGLRGGYVFAALVAALLMLLVAQYRETPADKRHHGTLVPPLELGVRPLAVVLMGVVFVTFSGLGFAFMFSMAKLQGMDYESAGRAIGALLLVSALACLAGGLASARFGPVRTLGFAFITCAASWWYAVHAASQAAFLIALVPAIFSLQFCFPVLIALAGSLDRDGRWAAIASPLITSGFAWAAILAGAIANRWGIDSLATANIAGMVVCLLLLAIAQSPAFRKPEPRRLPKGGLRHHGKSRSAGAE